MESAACFSNATTGRLPHRNAADGTLLSPFRNPTHLFSSRTLKKLPVQVRFPCLRTAFGSLNASAFRIGTTISTENESVEVDWDSLGFGLVHTDYMYTMKCSRSESFCEGELVPFGNIEISPSAGVLNYGQGLFEGLKAYRKADGNILLFRPQENGTRMMMGAERMCMPSPSVAQFVEAVKATVLANERWIPPPGKGSLYIRPLLMGSGSVLGLAPAPEYTFLIYVSPVGNYFKVYTLPLFLLSLEYTHHIQI
ncbi:unnamed protein product [Lactuca virosa]|uniref:Branched-chain-amino-acid aminotransferase n=1 Tax=Lactuca virosa TaxID=75947 RepID=A0AAU9NPK0_9ASTR|nr:unnamed protein product [Lactuca virosa]